MDWPNKIGDWLSLKLPRVVALGLATGALLLLPGRALAFLGLSGFADEFRPWIGGVFLMCVVIVAVEASVPPARHLKTAVTTWLFVRNRRRILRTLTCDEKKVLAEFLRKNTKTETFSAMDGVVAGLQKQQVLVQVTNLGYGPNFQFGLQPWAWQYLHRHPEILGITREEVGSARPEPPPNPPAAGGRRLRRHH